MKTGEAERWLQQQLQGVYDASESSAISTWVFEKVTGLSRLDRLSKQEENLPEERVQQLADIIKRLQAHEPVQYVLGEAYFAGLKLYVDPNVLIPRPETEELVAWIIADVKASRKNVFGTAPGKADQTRTLKILDVGTGSGCIALALKKALPKAEVWGCDISDSALNVARRNGAALDIRVDFQRLDLLDAAQWASLPRFDIIVSNPPYISEVEKKSMHPNVVAHEPHTALFVPAENPLLFYKALTQFGQEKLHAGGTLYMEIHEDRGEAIKQLFQTAMYAPVELRTDMQQKNRMVKAVVPLT